VTAADAPPVLTYCGFGIALLDERHVTITAPDGYRIVSGAKMTVASARNVIRGYRLEERLEQLTNERKIA
jgi:hypothetical protein